jgi:hypothetical protein
MHVGELQARDWSLSDFRILGKHGGGPVDSSCLTGQTGRHSGPEDTTCPSGRIALPPNPSPVSEDWKFLCLPFSLAVSNGATQRQSICLILRTPVAQKRAVSKEAVWYGITS